MGEGMSDLPEIDKDGNIPDGATCQEASIHSTAWYIPCGKPASAIVYHEKDRRGYYMCAPCADHNVRNRGGKLVKQLSTPPFMYDNKYFAKPLAGSREQPGKPARYDSFPLVSEFSRQDMDRAIELMAEDIALQEVEADTKESRKAVKRELGEIRERNTSKGGMRWGQLVMYDRGMVTRKGPPNAKKLVESGVAANTVESCRTDSKSYRDIRVVDVSKPSTSHGWDEEGD